MFIMFLQYIYLKLNAGLDSFTRSLELRIEAEKLQNENDTDSLRTSTLNMALKFYTGWQMHSE